MKLFKLNLPLYIVILLACGAFASGKYILSGKKTSSESSEIHPVVNCPASMEQVRLKDYELTHPLILTDISEESASLIRSKPTLMLQDQNKKQTRSLSISVNLIMVPGFQ